jgi:hypothetical protein
MMKEATDEKVEKDPLNLTLEVTKTQIVVKTGLRTPRTRTFASEQKKEIKEYLVELKKQYPKETTMILKADPKISFQNLVTAIDSTQNPKEMKRPLFPQIVFDNNGVGK